MNNIERRLERLEEKEYYIGWFVWLMVIAIAIGLGYLTYFGFTH